MATSETKLEIYLAEVTLNEGYPAEKMIVIENEDSYLNSQWADPKSMEKQLYLKGEITWKPH
jgi:sulfur carrier protein ThiS